MEVRTEAFSFSLLDWIRENIDDDAVGVLVVFRDTAGASDLACGNALAIVGSRNAVQAIGCCISNHRVLPTRFIQVPHADVVAPMLTCCST